MNDEIKIFHVSLSNGETLLVRADSAHHALDIAKRLFDHTGACLASQVHIHEESELVGR